MWAGPARSGLSVPAANARMGSLLPARTTNSVLGKRFTMTVWDTAEGRFVYTKNSAASLRAASTIKILTSAAALQTLGPSHLMPTTVLPGGPGTVVLRAGGDPLLKSANLLMLARDTATALRSSAAQPATPSASSTPSKPTAATAPGTSPSPAASAPPASSSTASPKGAKSQISVLVDDSLFPGPGQSRGWSKSFLPGQVRPVNAFARDDNKVRDPAADAGIYFARALRGYGITASYRGHGSAAAAAAPLASFPGHTIAAAVSRALLVSDNDTAEMLFRQVAVGRGLPADWAGARQATRTALAELNVPLAGVNLVDGSGLSLQGRLTATTLSATLARAISPQYPRLAGLRGWLPVAGRTGTLAPGAHRFTTAPTRCAAGHIQAKTGTLADAIALAGYADGADGATKIFVAVVNGRPTAYSRLTTRQSVDRAVATLTGCW